MIWKLLPLLVLVQLAGAAPNVLLIVSEDNGPELGCYGDPFAKTPVLDRLAEGGVRFDRAFTPYSVCSPSRASILTGRHSVLNGQLGLATHKYRMYEEFPNAFSLLRKAGCRTGLIGKLHVNPEVAFTRHIDFRAVPGANFGRKDLDEYAIKSGEFFRAAGDQPFFLSVNYPDAHFPLIARVGGLPEEPDLLRGGEVKPLPWVGCDSPRLREATANYYNCMSRLDTLVGRLLDELESSGKLEDTLIIYIGDHGAQFSRGKTSVYDAGTRIPFIVSWPGKVKAGSARSELVSVCDILPTVLDAAGAGIPEEVSGRALQPLLMGKGVGDWRESMSFITTGSAPGIGCLQFAHRTQRFKLIMTPPGQGPNLSADAYLKHKNAHFIGGCNAEEIAAAPAEVRASYQIYQHPPKLELYELDEDPEEFVNLAMDPAYLDVLHGLIEDHQRWQVEVGDPFADPANISFWIESEREARSLNYRGTKTFRWGYLDRFSMEN